MDYRDSQFTSTSIAPTSNNGEYITESVNGKWEIIKKGKLNHFFLSAFDKIYHNIAQAVATVEAPFTLEALLQCTEEQLEQLFADTGLIPYWSNIDHDVKAHFLYNLYSNYTAITTRTGLTALLRYVFNDNNITGEATSIEGSPHVYDILVDYTGSASEFTPTTEFTARLIEFVNEVVPVTEKLRALTYIEQANTINTVVSPMTTGTAFNWSDAPDLVGQYLGYVYIMAIPGSIADEVRCYKELRVLTGAPLAQVRPYAAECMRVIGSWVKADVGDPMTHKVFMTRRDTGSNIYPDQFKVKFVSESIPAPPPEPPIPPTVIYYTNTSADFSQAYTLYKGGLKTVYDQSGNTITFDSTKTYTVLRYHTGGGWWADAGGVYLTGQSGLLKAGYSGSNTSVTFSAVEVQI